MDGPEFCPACGTALETQRIEGRSRAYCPVCDRPVYRNPKPCAGVLVVDEEEVLLVERTNPPNVGAWSLPAGFLEHDEPPENGAVRELEEETGLQVDQSAIELFDTAFVPIEGRANAVVLVYRVGRNATDGEPVPGSDAADARFWDVEEVTTTETLEPGYEGIFRRAVEKSAPR